MDFIGHYEVLELSLVTVMVKEVHYRHHCHVTRQMVGPKASSSHIHPSPVEEFFRDFKGIQANLLLNLGFIAKQELEEALFAFIMDLPVVLDFLKDVVIPALDFLNKGVGFVLVDISLVRVRVEGVDFLWEVTNKWLPEG